ncbi:MAG: hypothetical protein IT437_09435 [Phycisphaerales bacterium]|nr:hypothetical protein [Phycisphaerales bacterium]
MNDRVARLRIGPYLFLRQMQGGRVADRWLAVHEGDDTSHVVHRIPVRSDDQARVLEAIRPLSHLDHPHILPIEQVSVGSVGGGNAWIVAPFTGTHEGLLNLADLLAAKGGRMPLPEAERALVQLLGASRYAHVLGCRHGAIAMNEVLVDRGGSLAVELYGVWHALRARQGAAAEVVRDEVRSIVEIGYQMLTGLTADEPRIPATRLVRRLDRRWEDWCRAGLDAAGGFPSVDAALACLPASVSDVVAEVKSTPVRTVFNRLGRALRSR